jgi:hypothetical protein
LQLTKKIGTCKLTGEVGAFIKAHIIPKALTYPADEGLPFAQTGHDAPPIKRWSSWYDPVIVTRSGEDILADYDAWGVETLRAHKLVWQSWGGQNKLASEDFFETPDSAGYGVRIISGIDADRLRLFFLSVLWRASVSEMAEFSEIQLRASQKRKLRQMLVAGNASPASFFPFSLTQLSTVGPIHNLAPLRQRKPIVPVKGMKAAIPIFRFYFDGLIAHFHIESCEKEVSELGDLLVGQGEKVIITMVPYEKSWQRENLALLIHEAETRWPDRLQKIPGFQLGG